jgi:hypothetical protein
MWALHNVNDGTVEVDAMRQKKKAPCAKGQLLNSEEAIQLTAEKEAKKKEDEETSVENRRTRVAKKQQRWNETINEVHELVDFVLAVRSSLYIINMIDVVYVI